MIRRILLGVVALAGLLSLGLHIVSAASTTTSAGLNWRWRLIDGTGFGSSFNRSVSALGAFNGALYAGTNNDLQAEIWRSDDGLAWTGLVTNTTGVVQPPYLGAAILDFAVFEDNLYASTLYRAQGGAIWRSPDGIAWTQVVTRNDSLFQVFLPFQVYSHTLYTLASTDYQTAEIWQTVDGVTWQSTFLAEMIPYTLAVFDGWLYAGGRNSATTAATIWRTDGSLWTAAADGLDASADASINSLAVFHGWLYAAQHTRDATSGYTSLTVWRSSNGVEWIPVTSESIDRINSGSGGLTRSTLVEFQDRLYLFTYDLLSGGDVWSSGNGVDWEQVGFDGWGDTETRGATASSIAIYRNRLFAGAAYLPDPSQLWLFLPQTRFLPVVVHN